MIFLYAGIVISASKPKIKATMITLKCKTCNKTVEIAVKQGLSSCTFPRVCEGSGTENANGQQRCPLDPFQVVAESSKFVDLQTLKIQEVPEKVPTGEMPRHMTLTLDRYLVPLLYTTMPPLINDTHTLTHTHTHTRTQTYMYVYII